MKKIKENYKIITSIMGLILFLLSFVFKDITFMLTLISYILISISIILNIINNFKEKNFFDENLLMFLATLGAFIIKEYHECIAVLLLYQIGEFLSDKAINKSKKSIIDLMDLKITKIHIKDKKEFKDTLKESVKINDIILVKPGEIIPLDGIIIKGDSTLDLSKLTGESVPKKVKLNDEVLSGSINIDSAIEIKVVNIYENSTINRILKLLENVSNNKGKTEKLVTKIAKVYTPALIFISALIFIIPVFVLNQNFNIWLYRALEILVISCPCALVISIPLCFFIGINKCSKNGVLVKGGAELEKISECNMACFDKTGTITKGVFNVLKIIPYYQKEEDLLYYACCGEYYSNHPIAKSIKEFYKGEIDESIISSYKEISGYGIKAKVDGKEIIIGNQKLFDKEKIKYPKVEFLGTTLLISLNNNYIGTIVIGDEIKNSALNIREKLNMKCVLVSGDHEQIVKKVATKLKFDEYHADLLPDEKVNIIKTLAKKNKIMFIGDGLNDAPVLALSYLGISMGGNGSDAAIEASDIVLMNDNVDVIKKAITISKITKQIIKQNIIFSLSVKLILIVLSLIGITNMWMAVFADVGVTLLTIANALKILKYNVK